MRTKSYILLIALFLLQLFCFSNQSNTIKAQKYKFIYVHGFGEKRFPPAFEKKTKKFLKPLKIDAEILTHRWNSQEMDLSKVVYQWRIAKKNAEKEAVIFAENVINKYEKEQVKYFLIGYSLGCKVIAEAFNHCQDLKYLKGVYFLGAALPVNYQINAEHLPENMKIINYYSDFFDTALKISFTNAEGIKAGGEVGFDNTSVFQNNRTVCTHVHKGGPIQRDYSDLAEPIVYLSFFKENIFIKGKEPEFNLEFPVAEGKTHWNDIFLLKDILIQQNVNSNLYRAVSIENNKRVRKAWGKNIHQILKQLGFFKNPIKAI